MGSSPAQKWAGVFVVNAAKVYMWIKLKKSIIVPGIPGILPGQPFDCPDKQAEYFIHTGKAEPTDDRPNSWTPDKLAKVTPIETREPEVEHRDPEPQKPKRGKSKLF